MTVARRICQGFVIVITIGSILLMLPISMSNGNWSHPVTALFTATSAVCVTGLSVVNVGEYYSFWGQLFLLLLVQIGALGYMTATTVLLLLLGHKFGLRQKVAVQQSLEQVGLAGVEGLIKSILATTIVFELTGILLLLLVFVPIYGFQEGLWYSIFHSVNSFNNAGFSLYSDSFVQFVKSPLLNFVITGLIIFGGLGYQVIMEMYSWVKDRCQGKQAFHSFSLHFKVVTSTTIFLLIVGLIAFFIAEFHNPNTLENLNLGEKLIAAWFQSVTTRTAGFHTIDIDNFTDAGLFLTIALMFIGASPGSTGGGIKTTTFTILFNSTKAALQGRDEVLCYQRKIPMIVIIKAIGIVFASSLLVVFATTVIAFTDRQLELTEIFFEVVSAFATVGLSKGVTSNFTIPGQLVLITIMYIGRVGVLLLVSTVFAQQKPSAVEYPEENLFV
ncbi:potassium uptake protein, TrkH family [Trichodesmium erythraeum IMS101]|uniref:Potassium uptake protein, TrkH family n=1 Tax=Trichodesmium erythraeum (strain IMS101) TaxID=203124 RepID=Q10XV4_TRIEI|nr:ATPase [Trichodesmium erythraeum GBRTRLIN201]MCH2049409.1 TrkH family potassium uptake protein [Trichodesmium sp. ALOHA_ZT_67]MCL2927735.1 TrkH family potassium uptake protein [Trichodesmium sp. MAG_R01]MDE5095622.1 TrkH family potassium uptake protein [Trichodesmium sp. St11_bin5]MDE5103576.1 TrkH family potassium uptake protein [Trichodesmium sp. St19_bin2]